MSTITVSWEFGDQKGEQVCLSDREAKKLGYRLFSEKLARVGIKPSELTSLKNKLYSLNRKLKVAGGEYKRRSLLIKYAPVINQVIALKALPLKVTFTQNSAA